MSIIQARWLGEGPWMETPILHWMSQSKWSLENTGYSKTLVVLEPGSVGKHSCAQEGEISITKHGASSKTGRVKPFKSINIKGRYKILNFSWEEKSCFHLSYPPLSLPFGKVMNMCAVICWKYIICILISQSKDAIRRLSWISEAILDYGFQTMEITHRSKTLFRLEKNVFCLIIWPWTHDG